ncbi:MAG: hypothetical protein D5S00_04830 [Tindallia sp. MSAO_Bac2]|nr:MAG: hypothetical protein D5S00_04830 [Tindallia sp. MSAO_Bac2]
MQDKIFDILKPYTENITFITLKPNISLGLDNYRVPPKGLDIPLLTKDMAERIKKYDENQIINLPMVIAGIGYILGIDRFFLQKDYYLELINATGLPIIHTWLSEAAKYQKKESFEEALIYSRSILILEPENKEASLIAGTALYQIASRMDLKKPLRKNVVDESLRFLEWLYEQKAQNPLIQYYLGMIYRENKTYNKALKMWQEAEKQELSEEEKAELSIQMNVIKDLAAYETGYQHVLRNEGRDGLMSLIPLLSRHENWWNLQFFVGLAYEQIHDFINALEHYKKVIEIKGYHEETYLQMANVYIELREANKAMSLLEEILNRNPNNAELKCRTAMVATMANQKQKALALIKEAEKQDPDLEILEIAKRQIQTLS